MTPIRLAIVGLGKIARDQHLGAIEATDGIDLVAVASRNASLENVACFADIHELLASGVEFDAVFGLNDTLALGAMRVLQEAGRRVPDDVAVLGFDGLDEAEYSIPSLTTVDPGREWIARTAVSTLLERIAGDADAPPRTLLADYRILQRESAPAN